MDKITSEAIKFDFPLVKVKEGSAVFMVPDVKTNYIPSKAPVFYNPKMELNRDFAIAFLQSFRSWLGREIKVCEPLSGCGVRGVRFAVEVDGLAKVVINDLNPNAAKLARLNVKNSGVEKIVEVYDVDASLLLSEFSKPDQRFDYVDIDPFGSPSPYIQPALKALRNDGVLATTATDMAPLCGVHSKACIRHYGIKPLRTEYCHELAVRILIGFIAASAARIDLAVEPLFCHSTDHYVRVYVKVLKGAKRADQTLDQFGYIINCFSCFNRKVSRGPFSRFEVSCEVCGRLMDFAGPLWLGRMWNKEIVEGIIEVVERKNFGQKKRMKKILQKILGEIDAEPTYYVLSRVCDFLNIHTPPLTKVTRKIEDRGYRVYPTHFNSQGIRTNMPTNVFQEVLLEMTESGRFS